MFRKLLVLSATVAGLVSVEASAAPSPLSGEGLPAPRAGAGLVQLAQSSGIQVYFDGQGRRVLVDRWSGEIIAIERPRSAENRRAIRERLRERERPRGQDRFYLDDPEDMARLDRLKRGEPVEPEIYVEPEPEVVRPRPRRVERERPRRPSAEERRMVLRERVPLPEFLDRDEDDFEPEIIEPDFSDPDVARPRLYERVPSPDFMNPDGDFVEQEQPERRRVERQPLPGAIEVPRGQAREETPVDPDPQVAARDPDPLDELPGETIVEEPIKPSIQPSTGLGAREDVAGLQVLLDRTGVSPGVIDGKFGSNVDKALALYAQVTGQVLRSTDTAGIREALASTGGDALVDYTITATDAAGPFVASVPHDYGEKSRLESLGFTSVAEMLAERFHMDEAYLKALNPEANFGRPGTIIRVANVGANRQGIVTRIIADKGKKQVRAYGADGRLVAAYPATIGSADTPSPTGSHTVARVAFDPEYTYNPKVNFKQGDNDKVLTIPPGPNGPVGTIWIALSKPTYGIHGTPDPSKIGKTESHGCVRLTNWDATELAKMVTPGVSVEFTE